MIDISKITEADIATAALVDDLDAAILPIMQKAGITTGDVAAQSFGTQWAKLNSDGRTLEIQEWLSHELMYAEEAAR